MPLPTLRDLVDAGAQFGHQRSRTHPAAKQFTYALRDRVYVINLEKTLIGLETAAKSLEAMAATGKHFIFVGTKQQAIPLVEAAATATGMSFINHRWLGGTLTNFETLRRNIQKLDRLEEVSESSQFEEFTKNERGRIKKQMAKLDKMFRGLRTMKKLPDAVIVVDVTHEDIAVTEASSLNIPIIGLLDTDANPVKITHPIPANYDSRKTIELVLNTLVEAIKAGQKKAPVVQSTAVATENKVIAEVEVEAPKVIKEESPVKIEKPKLKKVAKKPGAPVKATKPAKKATSDE